MKRLMVSLLVLAAMLSAALVEVDRAKSVAENYYKNYAPTALKGAAVTQVITKTYEGEVTYHIFGFGNNNGFVIVSADDAVRSILGWSFDSPIAKEADLYNMKNPFANRFEMYEKQIIEARKIGFVDAVAQKEWKDIENNMFPSSSKAIIVPALVTTRWGQGYPYNTDCPLDGGVATLVGCVATASAQVMRYHMGTTNPTGTHSYSWTGASSSATLSVDYTASTYDFALMPTLTSAINTTAEIDEVSEFCYETAVSVNMDFGTSAAGGSGTYNSLVRQALIDHFEYSTDASYVGVGTVTNETAQSANINASLAASRPIVWGGSGADGGHSFVLDGRTDDYQYHFNWGWEGYMDGWFKLNNLNPGSDFTSSQDATYNLYCVSALYDEWPAPTNLAGTLANGEDLTLTWTRPAGVKLGTLTGYKLYRNDVVIATLGTSALSYQDFDLSPATYNYYISATYSTPDGESHFSNNKTQIIVEDNNFPVAKSLSATTYGRTQIDVYWHKPFIGTIYLSDGFEDGSISDWTQKSHNVWGSAKAWTATTTAWKIGDAATWPDALTEGVRGNYSMGCIWNTALNAWSVYSPSFTSVSGATLSYYVWYENTNYPTVVYSGLYGGTWAETKWTAIVANMQVVDTLDAASEINHMETGLNFTTTRTGSNRVFFWYNYNDGWEFIVDDIVIGYGSKDQFAAKETSNAPYIKRTVRAEKPTSTLENRTDLPNDQILNYTSPKGSVEPTEYQVYRNGALAATVTRTGLEETWSDTGFADGWNEYYVRAVYPTGTSIPSMKTYGYIMANPAPGYLDGVLNGSNVDLTWYAPLNLPPHWFGYIEELDAAFDGIDGMTGTWAKRRTIFQAGYLGVGYEYPITVDSLAAAFYESDVVWTDSDFSFNVYTSNWAGDADSILYTSGTLTAVSDSWTTLALPSTLTMNWGWYVEINVNDNGTPSSLVSTHAASEGHSSVYYGGDGTYTAGWYTISYGDAGLPGDWAIICFGYAQPDTWYYNKSVPAERIAVTPSKIIPAKKLAVETSTKDSKAFVKYNVWRNGIDIADATITSYTDASPVAGDNVYEISAVYSSPAGESVKCASVTVNVAVTTPDAPTNVVTSYASNLVTINWDDMAGATSYNVYSSATPYGTFALLTNVTASVHTYTPTARNMFFYITSSNGKSAAPKTIEIAKPASSK